MFISLHSAEGYSSQQTLTLNSHKDVGNKSGDAVSSATDKVLNKLADNIPGMSGSDLSALKAEEFTPDKVSGRIADYVAMGLAQARRDGKSDAEIQNIYDQAVKGIEQGFKEARDILNDMDLMTDDISATIDETFDLTMQKVGLLAPGAEETTTSASTSISAAERYSSSESFSLKVKTQDGDKVTIRFSGSESYEASLGYYNDGEGTSAVAFNLDRSQQSNYQFSVKGDLDADELDALQNLVQDISLIADDFFDGDIQAAFAQASTFEMDKTELASMHLTLKRSEQYTAAAAYQQVQGYDQPFNHNGGRKLGHMVQSLQEQLDQSRLQFIDSIREFGQSLVSNLVEQDKRYQSSDSDTQSRYDQHLDMLKDMLAPAAETEA